MDLFNATQEHVRRKTKILKDDCQRRANKVILHHKTTQQNVKCFPAVDSYIKHRFPSVDISEVSIYTADHKVMSKWGFSVGGCYIDFLKIILVCNKITTFVSGAKDRINKRLRKYSADISVEDIVAHECLHAVSSAVNRYGHQMHIDEEEFVFTNSVDFYKQKGMTDEHIIDTIFLPFCIDVVHKRSSVQNKMNELGIVLAADLEKCSHKTVDEITGFIVNEARSFAHQMIDLYRQRPEPPPVGEVSNSVSKRFGSISLE